MAADPNERDSILAAIDAGASEILVLSKWMSANPELSCEERETSDRYVAYLSQRGFSVRRAVAGLETAFVAETGPTDAAFSVALLVSPEQM